MYLTNFSFQKFIEEKEGIISTYADVHISGWINNRDNLFEFKNRLEGVKEFKDIYFLPSSWVKPTNVSFSLEFRYDPQ